MSLVLELPEKLLAELRKLSMARDAPLEEVVLEAIFEHVNLSNPELKVELHLFNERLS
ncbi:hypothetical protein KEJ49_05615 [Candidatus Bathyarchaeota archaeon]|nr:hypothetical protein [Candidatus Bathyarchaeota archaeon]